MGEHKKPHVGYFSRFPPQLMPKKSQDQSEDQLPSYLTSTLKGIELCFQLVLFPIESKVSLDKIRLI